MGADRPLLDRVQVGFGGQWGAAGVEQFVDLALDASDFGQHVGDIGHLTAFDLQHPLALGLWHGQREPAGSCHFQALVGEPKGVRGVLDVIPVAGDQFGACRNPPARPFTRQPLALGLHVSQEPVHRAARQRRWSQCPQLGAEFGEYENVPFGGKEGKENGRVTFGRQAQVFPQRINDQICVTRAGARSLRVNIHVS